MMYVVKEMFDTNTKTYRCFSANDVVQIIILTSEWPAEFVQLQPLAYLLAKNDRSVFICSRLLFEASVDIAFFVKFSLRI